MRRAPTAFVNGFARHWLSVRSARSVVRRSSSGRLRNVSVRTLHSRAEHTPFAQRERAAVSHLDEIDSSISVPADTIFALSSGAPHVVSGVAIIRISGPDAHWAVQQLLKRGTSLPPARRACVRSLVDPRTEKPLDESIVLIFNAPASFTGEHVAELHVHGSRAVMRAVLDALNSLDGTRRVRAAERGEFTRRAFECGRLDLTAVEGLADLLAADTERQRVQALRAVGGAAWRTLESWRADALHCLAHAEAALDFADDVDTATFDAVVPKAKLLSSAISARVDRDAAIGEIVRDGVRVAIVGPPNAGKSSLLNALAQRPVAIVADVPGTTRDVLTVSLDLHGVPVILADTAGLRATPADSIEAEGMRRARQAVSDAHVALVMCDARNPEESAAPDVGETRVIRVANKIDLLDRTQIARLPPALLPLTLLSREGHIGDSGLDAVVHALGDAVRECAETDGNNEEAPVVTRVRHRRHLQRAIAALDSFVAMRSGDEPFRLPMDVAAEELRIVCKEIGAIVGAVHVEEVLDIVFSEFCIGK